MAEAAIKKIGILTGGGDCPGLNAVIRAAVKTAIIQYGWKVIGIEDGFEGLLKECKTRPLLYDYVKGIISRGGTILGSSNRGNPFEYKFREGGKLVSEDRSSVLIDNMRSQEIDALVIIGGDGTLSIALRLARMGVRVVGVPKTIDNDLAATDVTFGFDTAINTATEAIDKIRTTGESHHRVMIVEVMGRYTGWIALQAGIASGADIILIPEIPFNTDSVCNVINDRIKSGRNSTILVVAEGAKPDGGNVSVRMVVEDSHDPIRLGGIGDMVAEAISRKTHIETRVTVLGHIQRGGTPSAFDRTLATRLGVAAVDTLAAGSYGKMVCLHATHIEAVAIEDAVSQLKKISPDGEVVKAAQSIGVSFGK